MKALRDETINDKTKCAVSSQKQHVLYTDNGLRKKKNTRSKFSDLPSDNV